MASRPQARRIRFEEPERSRPSTASLSSESTVGIDPSIIAAVDHEIGPVDDTNDARRSPDTVANPDYCLSRATTLSVEEQIPYEMIPRDIESFDGNLDRRASLDDIIFEMASVDEEPKYDAAKDPGYPIPEELVQTNTTKGLDSVAVPARRRQFGFNELSEEKPHRLRKLVGFFVGPIQFVMLASSILAMVLGEWVDFTIVFSLLVLNALVGSVQDHHAGSVVNELKKTIANKCQILREGVVLDIESKLLVPGDIVLLGEGSVIPADGRLRIVQDSILQVDQSATTGESLAVTKYPEDILYQSSTIKRGEGRMVVIATGDRTFVGRSAILAKEASSGSGHFAKVINKVGTSLLVFVGLTLMVVFTTEAGQDTNFKEMLSSVLMITVAGVPVGLPAVVTTTMAVGASYLAKKKAIVQKLSAIEALAGVEILCSDKTGTLTKNKLSLGEPYLAAGINSNELVLTACLAASRKKGALDAIDKAFLRSLKDYDRAAWALPKFRILQFTPFDPVSKKVSALVEAPDGELITCVKGAPASVLQMASAESNIEKLIRQGYNSAVEEFASRGFRSLGVARRRMNKPWEILGIMPCYDPPRHDTAKTIREMQRLGLRVKILTGDAIEIAKETSRSLGLGTNIRNADGLGFNSGDSSPMSLEFDFIEKTDGFAEVFPQHKYNVVDLLQQRGYLVAMTGDGVNDAPSLKKANTGIAVEGASDAARSAADIVFLAPGLSVIIDAIKTSRQTFHRIHAYIMYRIALSAHMMLYIGIQFLMKGMIISTTLILLVTVFADLATLAIAYDNAPFSQLPVKWNLSKLWIQSLVLGAVLTIGTVLLNQLNGPGGAFSGDIATIESLVFLEVALNESWTIFITRATGTSKSLPSWPLVCAVLFVDGLSTVICVFQWFSPVSDTKTGPIQVIEIWVYSFFVFFIMWLTFWILETKRVYERIKGWGQVMSSQKKRAMELRSWPV